MARSNPLIKIVVTLAVLAGLGFLFIRSANSTRSAPYTVAGARLHNWTLSVEPATDPTRPLVVLRTMPEFASDLFGQVFARAGESLFAPTPPAIPLVLQGEFDRAFAGHATPETLLAAARAAGLESVTFEPRCLGSRRVSAPGVTRQLYFVLFDAPAFAQFRDQIGALAGGRGDFDPGALSPVLIIGASDPSFGSWLPLRADPKTDCVAPIVTSAS
jgi:hypothetical protein